MQTPKKIENLAPDIIQDILSRLPIHSLFQSRQVCPLWRLLINHGDHSLSKLHYTRSSQNPNPTSLIFLNHIRTSTCYRMWYLHDIDTPEKAIMGKILPFESLLREGLSAEGSLVGSCNGFICLSDALNLIRKANPILVVCNPVNGYWTKLPDPPKLLISHLTYFGFGYCPKGKEYKVVSMRGEHDCLTVQVHTLGSDAWRTIGTTTMNVTQSHYFGVHVSGYLHWLIFGDGIDYCRVVGIKTFNIEDEIFGVVPVPSSIKGKEKGDLFFGVLGGYMMIVDHSQMECQQVWLMKDYGNKTWILEIIIPSPPRQPNCTGGRPKILPLSMQNNGNVLVQFDCALFSYDPNTMTHELVRVPGLPRSFIATPHVGTLVTMEDVNDMPGL